MSSIIKEIKNINATSFSDEEERKQAVTRVHALLSRIESPWETASRLVLTIPSQLAALRVASDLGLFQKWLDTNGGSTCTVDQLSTLSGCNAQLLKRLLDHLAATHTIKADDQGGYEMATFSRGLIKDDFITFVDLYHHICMPLSHHMPDFFKTTGYQPPTGGDGKDLCKDWSGKTIWEYIAANPEIATSLGRYMKATGSQRGNFAEIYPCETLSCTPDDPLIVDIGGSMGHDLQAFQTSHPQATGRLILQDKPDVIELSKQVSDPTTTATAVIKRMSYDFFTPQPVTGAKIYLLHAVLHDWPDADAVRILQAVKPAMQAKYSKLLIHEVVMPMFKPVVEETARDLVMLYMASGSERNEEQWRSLIDSAGLKIVKIWRSPLYAEAVVEVELAA